VRVVGGYVTLSVSRCEWQVAKGKKFQAAWKKVSSFKLQASRKKSLVNETHTCSLWLSQLLGIWEKVSS
jgi:hypothetical protein